MLLWPTPDARTERLQMGEESAWNGEGYGPKGLATRPKSYEHWWV